jgi:hypothetical protein
VEDTFLTALFTCTLAAFVTAFVREKDPETP